MEESCIILTQTKIKSYSRPFLHYFKDVINCVQIFWNSVCLYLHSTKNSSHLCSLKGCCDTYLFPFGVCNLNSVKRKTQQLFFHKPLIRSNSINFTLNLQFGPSVSLFWACSVKLGRLLLCCLCFWDCIFVRGRLDGTASVCWEKLFRCCQLNLRICCRGQEILRMFISTEAESIYLQSIFSKLSYLKEKQNWIETCLYSKPGEPCIIYTSDSSTILVRMKIWWLKATVSFWNGIGKKLKNNCLFRDIDLWKRPT